MKRLAIVALSLATALTSVGPAMAFPPVVPLKVEVPQAQPVSHRNGDDDWAWALGGLAAGTIIGGLLTQPRYYGPRYYGPSYYDEGYYHGPTYYRPRYYAPAYYAPRYYAPRYYAPSYYRQTYYGGNAHARWCYARYRSYRAYDNTFQPYYGPRRPCVSPYY
ncbi:BA14K family protein [Ensifer aridi]|uniref:BA14K family protein n=1 Tax=Ensifer aridi TaxID=1708715 RepID=UPI000A0F9B4A|nr:BA14K family protein [Ensifer aridi]